MASDNTKKTSPTREISIGEIADLTGVTRRVVRFYVQRGLIDPPEGRGRGSFYTERHLARIQRILQLQAAGHSLDAISRMLDQPLVSEFRVAEKTVHQQKQQIQTNKPGAGKDTAPRHVQRRAQAKLNVELWTRVAVMPGVEMNINVSKHDFDAEDLQRLKDAVAEAVVDIGGGTKQETR